MHDLAVISGYIAGLLVWLSGNIFVSINIVTLRRAQLVSDG